MTVQDGFGGGIHWIMAFLSTSLAKRVDNNSHLSQLPLSSSLNDYDRFDNNGNVALTSLTSFAKSADIVLATVLSSPGGIAEPKLSDHKPVGFWKFPIKYLPDVSPGKFAGWKNSLIGSCGGNLLAACVS